MKGLSASNRIKIKCAQEQIFFFFLIYTTDLLTKTSECVVWIHSQKPQNVSFGYMLYYPRDNQYWVIGE